MAAESGAQGMPPLLSIDRCEKTDVFLLFSPAKRCRRCRVGFDPPQSGPGGSINRSAGPEYAIRNDPLKLKVDTKHRLLMLNTCNVDEYSQNTPAYLRHISSQVPLGPRTTDLKS